MLSLASTLSSSAPSNARFSAAAVKRASQSSRTVTCQRRMARRDTMSAVVSAREDVRKEGYEVSREGCAVKVLRVYKTGEASALICLHVRRMEGCSRAVRDMVAAVLEEEDAECGEGMCVSMRRRRVRGVSEGWKGETSRSR